MLVFALGCIDGSLNVDDTAQSTDDTAWQCGLEHGTVHLSETCSRNRNVVKPLQSQSDGILLKLAGP